MPVEDTFPYVLINQATKIPDALSPNFSPAQIYFHEWKKHYLNLPGVTHLKIAGQNILPISADVFEISFENNIGLTNIQAFSGDHPLGPKLFAEVISNKFPDIDQHLEFFQALLEDIFAHSARMPFHFESQTQRGVQPSPSLPSALFTLHYLINYSKGILNAIQQILHSPYRVLSTEEELVPLGFVSEMDEDIVLKILHSPQHLHRAPGNPIAEPLKGYLPNIVWQRLPNESLDVPENRFIKAFLQSIQNAARNMQHLSWWRKLSFNREKLVRETMVGIQQALSHPIFDDIGEMKSIPFQSRILLMRNGYRELFFYWQMFQIARRPIFGNISHAIDLRDIPTLYEIWVFYNLVEEIQMILNIDPKMKIEVEDSKGLVWNSKASFGDAGTLIYNWSSGKKSYSINLRPDYVWFQFNKLEVVFDAKFRLQRNDFDTTENQEQSKANPSDLYKMHTYRDALKARAAVSIYPGTESVFYQTNGDRKEIFNLEEILFGGITGIGAYAIRPFPMGN